MREKVIIDTDGGVDDCMAILLALSSQDKVHLLALTTVAGNVPLDIATDNVLKTISLWNSAKKPAIPNHPLPRVFKGAEKPLQRDLCTATFVHGADGLGGKGDLYEISAEVQHLLDCSSSAVDGMIEILRGFDQGTISVVTIGPLTNLALLKKTDPVAFSRIGKIVCMAGAFRSQGNSSLAAEFNAIVDPEALSELLDETDGKPVVPVYFVSLDVTETVWMSKADMDVLKDHSFGSFLVNITGTLFDFLEKTHGKQGDGKEDPRGMHMHDPLAMALVIDPEISTGCSHVQVCVETKGEHTFGMTLADLDNRLPNKTDPPNAFVYTSVSSEKFFELFHKRVFS